MTSLDFMGSGLYFIPSRLSMSYLCHQTSSAAPMNSDCTKSTSPMVTLIEKKYALLLKKTKPQTLLLVLLVCITILIIASLIFSCPLYFQHTSHVFAMFSIDSSTYPLSTWFFFSFNFKLRSFIYKLPNFKKIKQSIK